ncbi:MAG TPA: PLP-dependent aminotransferase family protein [Ktedonobacteraceae bacterium]|jgi:GntR family transcriptional regulator/MocR family aminotransferase
MHKQQNGVLFLPFRFDPDSSIPLYRQLYDEIRHAILQGQLSAGTQLPSTRALANHLGISRTTVVLAFDQLLLEGYVEGKKGSGTYVASVLPEDLLHRPIPIHAMPTPKIQPAGYGLSARGKILAQTDVATIHYYSEALAFRPGIPDLNHFPFEIWARLEAQHWQHAPRDLLGYSHPAGYYPLRAEIAGYLRAARGVQCTAEQIIVVSGSQQAIDLAARLLLDPDDPVWMEDPGYSGARSALLASGARLVPIPVDAEGLDVAAGIARAPDARLVYTTPSYQFPLGTTMSLTRRLQLLQWAEQSGAWMLEDDYDSEFRYAGRPLSSLQGLDTTGQVIYIGTFSKTLFPGLRLGYLVAPPHLVDAFTAARAVADRHSPMLDQIVLSEFMAQGHFARHIRHMRRLYAERQAYLIEEATHELAGLLTIRSADAGMHLIGILNNGMQAEVVAQQAAQQHLIVPAMSEYNIASPHPNAILLGYTAVTRQEISTGIRQLATILSSANAGKTNSIRS